MQHPLSHHPAAGQWFILRLRGAAWLGLALALLLAACGGQGAQVTPLSRAHLTKTAEAIPTATRTFTPSPTPTVTPSSTPTSTPTATPTLTPSRTPFVVSTNTPRPTRTPLVVAALGPPDEAAGGQPTWTPPPLDQALAIEDHYWFARPIPNGLTSWAARNYPYGGTNGGRLQVHLGIDLVNPTGTPVLAVQDGTVYYAGDDVNGPRFGPIPNYYGTLVVIQHDFVTPDTGEPVFSLYGHLLAAEVEAGQRVTRGQQIGLVGASGVALGPHLHFEVRVGDPQSFNSTRNPELWLRPYQGFGTLAGRVTDSAGNFLYEVTLSVTSALDPDFRRAAFSYADDSVNPDTTFGENFVLGDLPADYYEVVIRSGGGTLYRDQVYVYPNRTTWLDITLP